MSRVAINLLIILASAAISILFAELILWQAFPLSYHTTPLWKADGHIRGRYAPNQSFVTAAGHNPLNPTRRDQHTNHINRFGFRGPDYDFHAHSETLRIAVFGGSAAFGYHDPEDMTWPQLLGKCLSETLDRQVEVLNLSLPGFTLGISKINYLVKGRAFSPDIVIAYHTWNDLKSVGLISENPEAILNSAPAQPEPSFRRALRAIAYYSQIVRRLRILYYEFRNSDREGVSVRSFGWSPSELAENWFRSNFEDFVRFARADGVLPVIATQGTIVASENLEDSEILRHVSNDFVGLSHSRLVDVWSWANSQIEEIAKETGTLFVDVYDELPHTMLYLEDHVHLTREGQRRVSDIFCERMSRSPAVISLASGSDNF